MLLRLVQVCGLLLLVWLTPASLSSCFLHVAVFFPFLLFESNKFSSRPGYCPPTRESKKTIGNLLTYGKETWQITAWIRAKVIDYSPDWTWIKPIWTEKMNNSGFAGLAYTRKKKWCYFTCSSKDEYLVLMLVCLYQHTNCILDCVLCLRCQDKL